MRDNNMFRYYQFYFLQQRNISRYIIDDNLREKHEATQNFDWAGIRQINRH